MMKFMRQILQLILCLLFSLPTISRAEGFVRDDIIRDPAPEHFSVCHGYSCKHLSVVSLTPAEWTAVVASFYPYAESAAVERAQMRLAVAKMEHVVGAITGTSADRERNEPNDVGERFRMDCIDESTNTTLYLTLFKRLGFLRHHVVLDRAKRGFFPFGWPHFTAVIRDSSDGSKWAVDSWFLDNGKPPFVVPLEQWQKGWRPSRTVVTEGR